VAIFILRRFSQLVNSVLQRYPLHPKIFHIDIHREYISP
jgi:hypothetical protein